MSTPEGDEFLGKMIKGKIGRFFVTLELDPSEHLFIHLENEQTFDVYKCMVESVDINEQNYASGVSWIDTPSELFQAIDSILSANKKLNDIMEFNQSGVIKFELELKLDFRMGSKKQKIVYHFRSEKMAVNEIERMRVKFHTFVSEREGDLLKIKLLEEQVSKLVLENEKLNQQIQQIKDRSGTVEHKKRQNACFQYVSSNSIIFTNPQKTIAFQTRRSFDIVLVNRPINPLQTVEWKFVIHTPMELVFGLCKKSDTKLSNEDLNELIFQQKAQEESIAVLSLGHAKANSIVMCNFDGLNFRFSIECLQLLKQEEEEEQFSFFRFTDEKILKKLIKYENVHAFIGLNHGRRVQLLSYEVISPN